MTPGTWTRIITNILGNAMKYTPAGVVSITLSTEQGNTTHSDEDETVVSLRIEDTGIGMSKKFINSGLFTPFKQADGLSTGTGLGLSIVKGIAKEIGASVSVESQLGKGTSVLVQFKATFIKSQDSGLVEFSASPMTNLSVFCMLNVDDCKSRGRPLGTRLVSNSVLRTASDWLGCTALSTKTLKPSPRASMCAISENDLDQIEKERPGGVKSLVTNLAGGGIRLVILGRSIGALEAGYAFKDFPVIPTYIHQP